MSEELEVMEQATVSRRAAATAPKVIASTQSGLLACGISGEKMNTTIAVNMLCVME